MRWVSWSDQKTNGAEHPTTTESQTYKQWTLGTKKDADQASNMPWMNECSWDDRVLQETKSETKSML
jgi:hypothetical protein